MKGKTPPHDLAAEESLIGAALLRQQIVGQLAGTLDPSDFYKPQHQAIWDMMLHLHHHGRPIDVITVRDACAETPGVTAEMLIDLQNATPAVSSYGTYAGMIIERSRSRRLIAHLGELSERAYVEPADDILGDIDPGGDHLIAPRSGSHIEGLSTMSEFMDRARSCIDDGVWLIPHTLRPRWRQIIVAGEGVGKGTLLRMLGLHVAAGRDPWNPMHFIERRRVLYVDCENPETTIALQVDLANAQINLTTEAGDMYHLWHREGGMDLRKRRAQAEFERVLQQTQPEIVFMGPLYKLYRRTGAEDMEQATLDFLSVLDDFRTRYNFAIILEHHAPKGESGRRRDINPFGSSALLRWPEHGITLEVTGNPLPDDEELDVLCGRFRRDREPMDWPATMHRGGFGQKLAWVGRWPKGRNPQGWPYENQSM